MQKFKSWFNNEDNKYSIIFILLFILICLIYQYQKILFLRPQGIHQWRQTIGLSFALSYYQQGMNFFAPEVHQLVADGRTTGYAAAEFPVLYFITALMWKIFGIHEFIPRLINLFIVFCGFFSLFKMASKRTDAFWGILLPLILFTSPVIAYYGICTLPDGPAFGIALISIYCFDKFIEKQKYNWLYMFMTLSLIAGLLKATSVMVFSAILIIYFLERAKISSFQTGRKIFNRGWVVFVLFLVTIIGISAWYVWAIQYNKVHGGHISDSTILPIWDMNAEEMFNVIKSVYEIVWYQFFCPHTTFLFLFLFIAIFF